MDFMLYSRERILLRVLGLHEYIFIRELLSIIITTRTCTYDLICLNEFYEKVGKSIENLSILFYNKRKSVELQHAPFSFQK